MCQSAETESSWIPKKGGRMPTPIPKYTSHDRSQRQKKTTATKDLNMCTAFVYCPKARGGWKSLSLSSTFRELTPVRSTGGTLHACLCSCWKVWPSLTLHVVHIDENYAKKRRSQTAHRITWKYMLNTVQDRVYQQEGPDVVASLLHGLLTNNQSL